MPKERSPERDKAFELYKEHNGNIANREIANRLGVPEKSVGGWKVKDKWDDHLSGCVSASEPARENRRQIFIQKNKANHSKSLYEAVSNLLIDAVYDNDLEMGEKLRAVELLIYLAKEDNIGHKINKLSRYFDQNKMSEPEWKCCKDYFNNACAYCGEETETLEKEHFITYSPVDSSKNIIPACSRCNKRKNKQDVFEWFIKQPFYTEEKLFKITDYLGIEIMAVTGDG